MKLVLDIRISLHSIITDNYIKITGGNKKDLILLMQAIEFIIDNKITTNTQLIITVDMIDINQKEINNIIKFYRDRINLLEIWKPHNWVSDLKYRKGPTIKNTCGRPERSPLQIQVDGTINMCCFDYNGKLLLGDFKIQTLNDIFNSNPYIDLKKHHIEGTLDQTNYICKDCDQRKESKGIVIYNSAYKKSERLYRTSTNYKLMIKE
jgi:hypothetical protein